MSDLEELLVEDLQLLEEGGLALLHAVDAAHHLLQPRLHLFQLLDCTLHRAGPVRTDIPCHLLRAHVVLRESVSAACPCGGVPSFQLLTRTTKRDALSMSRKRSQITTRTAQAPVTQHCGTVCDPA